ncbi:hypothetical protein B2G71_07705 [Novosphingobium sp. PC22D]|uniref:hypothetical protein n=1 Tax=Novosphingobium sp. PC22D TaxID=1962403 RepID=UPI000BEFB31F|nr:hypothetical protein [Novosphingobium sp. PC22D]PEQ13313.1 hypothetical protein B2G71_07705 [Novosphingobium sp. PC22D]
MTRNITKSARIAVAALALAPATAMAIPMLYEEQLAHSEETRIIRYPIAGIENQWWFNYRSNVGEARKELASDLKRASDTEDKRDAWDEYAGELKDERVDYVKKMQKKGYPVGEVYVGD